MDGAACDRAVARAARSGLLPLARELAEERLAAAPAGAAACRAAVRASALALAAGDLERTAQVALAALGQAEALGDAEAVARLRLDLAEAALAAADPDAARDQLALLPADGQPPSLTRRAARLRAYATVAEGGPAWLRDGAASLDPGLDAVRAAAAAGRAEAVLRALGRVLAAPDHLLVVRLVHLCAGAAACAQRAGQAAAASDLGRLAAVGLRVLRLGEDLPDRAGGAARGPEPAGWRRLATWVRLLVHLFLKDPAAYRHSVRVAAYARSLCRLAGGGRTDQRHAVAVALLHDVGRLAALRPAAGATPRGRRYRAALAAAAARRLGLPAAVVDALGRSAELLAPPADAPRAADAAPPLARVLALAHAYDELTTGADGRGAPGHAAALEALARRFGPQEPHLAAVHRETAAVLTAARARRVPRAVRAARGSVCDPARLLVPPPVAGAGELPDRVPHMVLQPIVDLASGGVHGYEALARGHPGEDDGGAAALFAAAERAGRAHDLADRCLRRALAVGAQLPVPGARLFVNLDPSVLDGPEVLAALRRRGAAAVVLEFSERWSGADLPGWAAGLGDLRRRGLAVALDDFGAAYSGPHRLLQLQPDYVKLDMALVRAVDRDRRRAALIRGIVDYCHQFGARVVAEGVETVAELRTLCALGVDLAQGYLIARPAAQPAPPSRAALAAIRAAGRRRPDAAPYS
jgi:EAL domain-containing protein (putative c-di-GMP-specific phosphodiesterase class I)